MNGQIIDGGNIEEWIDPANNQETLRYLTKHNPSCHDDAIGLVMRHAKEKCGEWIAYNPSWKHYRYVALITNRKIFILGTGQRSIVFRLPPDLFEIALKTGANEATEVGHDWVQFELFRNNWPMPDLPFWVLKSYAHARSQL